MKKILIAYGTRPELIKMAPLIRAVNDSSSLKAVTCSTGQHRELLHQVLEFFEIENHHTLNVMKANQDLFDVTGSLLSQLREVLVKAAPDLVLVQGDTTTAFVTALCASYLKIPIGHVEAGLRTFDKGSPFPEELNRTLISKCADYHFAPTDLAVKNLLQEGIESSRIFKVGNTGVDALLWAASAQTQDSFLSQLLPSQKKWILFTSHRRENFGAPMEALFSAVRQFAETHPQWQIVFPVHPNPNVKRLAQEKLGDFSGVTLLEPLDFGDLVWLLQRVAFVVTDSGGLQEEAPTFGKPVLVMRETTERSEAITAGCAELVGVEPKKLLHWMEQLSQTQSLTYRRMARAQNPFGDGTASQQIVKILETSFAQKTVKAA